MEAHQLEDPEEWAIAPIADITLRPTLIPMKFHRAIGAVTELETIGVELSYAEITERIKVYYVKGYKTYNVKGYKVARFALDDLLSDGLRPICYHDSEAYKTTDRRRYHGNSDLYELLRSDGVVHKSARQSSTMQDWYHFGPERALEALKNAPPQNLGGADFRVMTEFLCNCWNSCKNQRTWCYTRSNCTNYAMKAFWLFPAENCSNVPLFKD